LSQTTADPVALLRALDPEVLVLRLEELRQEEKWLRGLLRAFRARQRAQERAQAAGDTCKGVAHAS
jgi:hypothetical protein